MLKVEMNIVLRLIVKTADNQRVAKMGTKIRTNFWRFVRL
jgi:hypothetical protein